MLEPKLNTLLVPSPAFSSPPTYSLSGPSQERSKATVVRLLWHGSLIGCAAAAKHVTFGKLSFRFGLLGVSPTLGPDLICKLRVFSQDINSAVLDVALVTSRNAWLA